MILDCKGEESAIARRDRSNREIGGLNPAIDVGKQPLLMGPRRVTGLRDPLFGVGRANLCA
jgi:hypothetical protein